MKPISSEIVEKTWQKIGGFSARQVEKLAERMSQDQPLILAYLMAVDSDLLDQDERELLFYLGVVIWQIMLQGDKPLPDITESMLDEAEEANTKFLEKHVGASEVKLAQASETLIRGYGQPEVFRYAVEALMESAREEEIRQDNLGILMINLKTVIDCFDR